MSAERLDHAVEARSRVATQYQESAKFLSTLQRVSARLQDVEEALIAVRDITDIDTARGVQLDIIGDIVGVSRIIPNAIPLPFFGFSDGAGSQPFGEEVTLSIGARFREEKESHTATTSLGDPEFRLIIRAKIVKNHSKGTGDDILNGMAYIFQGQQNIVEDVGGMRIKLAVGRMLTKIERLLVKQLDLLPRPAGVRISGLVAYDATKFFGFADQLNAKGFADAPSGGGLFAEEF